MLGIIDRHWSESQFFCCINQASGATNAICYLKDLSLQWGTIYTGCLSRTMFNIEKSFPEETMKLFKTYLDIDQRKRYSPTYGQIYQNTNQKMFKSHRIDGLFYRLTNESHIPKWKCSKCIDFERCDSNAIYNNC